MPNTPHPLPVERITDNGGEDFNDLLKLASAQAAGLLPKPCPFCGGEAKHRGLEAVTCTVCAATTHTWMRPNGCYSGFSAWQHRVNEPTAMQPRDARALEVVSRALEEAKEKLGLYRNQHSGEYIGGIEYTALIREIHTARQYINEMKG